MFATIPYHRARAREYARRWAFDRNPQFVNFTGQGGDCTNYVSQCLLAGGCIMNFTPDLGWYYRSSNDRAAAWTGVEFFWKFMTTNRDVGPFGVETNDTGLDIGDVIQLGTSETDYYHTLFVTGIVRGTYLVSAHSDDAFDRPLNTYRFNTARYLHIEGFRASLSDQNDCFQTLIGGTGIPQNDGQYAAVNPSVIQNTPSTEEPTGEPTEEPMEAPAEMPTEPQS